MDKWRRVTISWCVWVHSAFFLCFLLCVCVCVCVCVLGPEGPHNNGHPIGSQTENDETGEGQAGRAAHVLRLSQTDSSITAKIQRCTLAQRRAQAANSMATPHQDSELRTDSSEVTFSSLSTNSSITISALPLSLLPSGLWVVLVFFL